LLDVLSGANYLGFTEKATRHMIGRGALPALRLRGRLFFRRETLERFLAQKEREFTKERAS
jgi:excisionase family DNA binding protein